MWLCHQGGLCLEQYAFVRSSRTLGAQRIYCNENPIFSVDILGMSTNERVKHTIIFPVLCTCTCMVKVCTCIDAFVYCEFEAGESSSWRSTNMLSLSPGCFQEVRRWHPLARARGGWAAAVGFWFRWYLHCELVAIDIFHLSESRTWNPNGRTWTHNMESNLRVQLRWMCVRAKYARWLLHT